MKNKKVKNIVKISILTILSILLGLKIYSSNVNSLTGKQMAMPFGYGMGYVTTGSMEPEYLIDDLIIVKKCKTYQVDDVIVFQDGNSLVVHRIVSINGKEIITRGDANTGDDDPIDIEKIYGKVIKKFNGGGSLIRKLKSPVVIVVIILLAFILMEISFLSEKKESNEDIEKIKKEIKELKEKIE